MSEGGAHGNHKSGDVEAEAFLCLTHVVQASFLRVSGKQGRKKGDVRERKRGKWKSKRARKEERRGKRRTRTKQKKLWLLLPFALEADLCEIVAAFLQTPLPKKEREVDVGEKKERRKKTRRKEERKLAGVEGDEHKAFALSAWLSPLSPSLLPQHPFSLLCLLEQFATPPCFLWLLGFVQCTQATAREPNRNRVVAISFALAFALALALARSPSNTPLPCLWLVVLFTAALQGSGGTCRWTFAPRSKVRAPTAMPSCLNSSCVCTINDKPRHLTDAGLANGSDNDHRLDHGFNSL